MTLSCDRCTDHCLPHCHPVCPHLRSLPGGFPHTILRLSWAAFTTWVGTFIPWRAFHVGRTWFSRNISIHNRVKKQFLYRCLNCRVEADWTWLGQVPVGLSHWAGEVLWRPGVLEDLWRLGWLRVAGQGAVSEVPDIVPALPPVQTPAVLPHSVPGLLALVEADWGLEAGVSSLSLLCLPDTVLAVCSPRPGSTRPPRSKGMFSVEIFWLSKRLSS